MNKKEKEIVKMQKNKDVIEINVADLFVFMLKRWYIFLISVIITVTVGMSICLFAITPTYESTTKIIILSPQNIGSLTYSDMQLASQLTKDYEELIVSRDVLEPVISECDLKGDYEDLLKRVEVENITDTRIISITVEDSSPVLAQKIASSIRETAAAHIKNVTDVEAVNVAEAANLPAEPASPSKLIWAVLSFAFGLIIAIIALIVGFLLDDTIKYSSDIEKYLALSTLALIPKVTPDGQTAVFMKVKSNSRKHSADSNKTAHESRS